MTHYRRTVLKGIGSAGLIASVVGTASAGSGDARYVVTAGGGAEKRIERVGFAVRHRLADGSVLIVEGPADEGSALKSVGGVRTVARDLRLAFEEPVLETAPDTEDEALYDLQWDKQVTRAGAAHDITTGEGATLAILDTGVDHDHPDLTPNLDADRSRLFRAGEIRDGSGEIEVPVDRNDERKGTTTIEAPLADDVYGHGSHVGGIAAAPRNDAGIVGTAPDASLVSLRVFYYDEVENEDGELVSSLTTTTADILLAIDFAARMGADAANMSLGTPPLPPKSRSEGMHVAYQRVIQSATRRGTLVVASAGNAETDLQHGGQYSLPNSVPGAMSVSATGPNGELSFYSNYGTGEIDVGAPGGAYETTEKSLSGETEWPYPTNFVLSTVPPEYYGGQTHAYFIGTSMAAPQVAGIAGLVRSIDPDLSANRVEQAIAHGAVGSNGRSSPDLGAGRVDALNTVERVSDGR
ncbi:Serine protease, subtilisin family [Natronoarchaeum philippinense]|uniref:Serine protease, subtilisin family n=1 Tax=Natronoarchaeum philippinense TaxID=558529 RepID=A0A285NAM2_NATPI|nr:S8 family serine peptidase [Natronoarchaeum philippinense]SNZ05967.1 Serine protease, subtilisin family [Natronoarchaeum philippinense]